MINFLRSHLLYRINCNHYSPLILLVLYLASKISVAFILMEIVNVKEEARRLIDKLPENCTWDDLIYAIYIRQGVEAGLADVKAGRIRTVEEVRRKVGLST